MRIKTKSQILILKRLDVGHQLSSEETRNDEIYVEVEKEVSTHDSDYEEVNDLEIDSNFPKEVGAPQKVEERKSTDKSGEEDNKSGDVDKSSNKVKENVNLKPSKEETVSISETNKRTGTVDLSYIQGEGMQREISEEQHIADKGNHMTDNNDTLYSSGNVNDSIVEGKGSTDDDSFLDLDKTINTKSKLRATLSKKSKTKHDEHSLVKIKNVKTDIKNIIEKFNKEGFEEEDPADYKYRGNKMKSKLKLGDVDQFEAEALKNLQSESSVQGSKPKQFSIKQNVETGETKEEIEVKSGKHFNEEFSTANNKPKIRGEVPKLERIKTAEAKPLGQSKRRKTKLLYSEGEESNDMHEPTSEQSVYVITEESVMLHKSSPSDIAGSDVKRSIEVKIPSKGIKVKITDGNVIEILETNSVESTDNVKVKIS